MASYVEDTELRLGLPGSDAPAARGSKRSLPEDSAAGDESCCRNDGSASAAKAQVVGWPPIGTYRKKLTMTVEPEVSGLYVKVSMDGAPYLRKIDLKIYKGYQELKEALDSMFNCFSQGELSRKEGRCRRRRFPSAVTRSLATGGNRDMVLAAIAHDVVGSGGNRDTQSRFPGDCARRAAGKGSRGGVRSFPPRRRYLPAPGDDRTQRSLLRRRFFRQ